MIGIYKIIINNKVYIGSSFNIQRRLIQHKSDLKNNRHDNQHLQNAYNKHKKITTEIVETFLSISDEKLRQLEREYIKLFNAEYNIQDPETHFGIKKVYQYTKDRVFVKEWNSTSEAAEFLNISVSSIIHAAQENEKETKSAGGFYWSYTPELAERKDNRLTPVYVYDLWGNFKRSYKSIEEAKNIIAPDTSYNTFSKAVNCCTNYVIASYRGVRLSTIYYDKLDNTKLLTITKNYPIIQLSKDNKVINIWDKAASAAKTLRKCKSSEITQAALKGKTCRGYKWLRLGTKSSELLEHPEGIEAKSELETIDANA